MPHNVNIGIHLIAKSVVDTFSAREWLNSIGATDFFLNLDDKTDAETLIEVAGRRCYMSFQKGLNPNITKIRADIAEYIDNILKSGHGSVLEHAVYTFAIEGVSRVFTGEMNRHRAGWAISEGSMRYIRFDDIGWWMPPSLEVSENDSEELKQKKESTKMLMHGAFAEAERYYKLIADIWKDELSPESTFKDKKIITSMMRRIIPMGTATGGIWTGNIRAIRHVITMRTTPAAEEEICYVFSNIIKKLAVLEPNLFGDFEQVEGGFYVPKYVKV